jgi:hypothetical protein
MRPVRRTRLAVLVLLVGLVVAGVWVAWQAWHVSHDLNDAADAAGDLQAAVVAADQPRVDAALARLKVASGSAADRTDGPTWAVLRHLPVVGDDAQGVALVSDVLDDLSTQGLAPVSSTLQHLDRLLPRDAKVSLDDLEALQAPVSAGDEAFSEADSRLAAEDPSGYVGRLREKYRELADRVHAAAVLLSQADTALAVMPDMLGADGPRNYLMVFQNNAEIRASGGLPGAVSLVHTDDGSIGLTRQVAAGSFGETARPVLPLTPTEVKLFGPQLGTYFLDANFTPDFPRASELWRARWQAEFDEGIDGVFTVDPVTLSYLLEATGPVTVSGVELTAQNVVRVVENLVYVNVPDPLKQDEFLNAVAKRVFDTFADGGADPVRVIQALFRGVAEGRVRIHSFTEADQALVEGTEIAGELPVQSGRSPQVGVYLNDATGSKMSYYLQYSVDVAAISCADDRQSLLGRLEISSKTPPNPELLPETVTGFDAARDPFIKRGQQFVVGDIFAPTGGEIGTVTVDGERLDPPVIDRLNGRELVSLAFLFRPRETHLVTWEMRSGPDQDGDTQVAVTPGVLPESESSTVPSAC